MGRILVVDDDAGIQSAFDAMLQARGHEVLPATSGEAALQLLAGQRPDVIVMDVWLPGMNGLQTFRKIQETNSEIPVIVITGSGTMDLAIEATRMGAFDYQVKPFDPGALMDLIERAVASARVRGEDDAGLGSPSNELLVGQSPAMLELYKMIGRVAPTDATVLICGESGSGKKRVAEAIHRYSRRSREALAVVRCASTPDPLLDAELFGGDTSPSAGAAPRRTGALERAARGTILLDEIGDLSPGLQARILRALQDRAFERGSQLVPVDVRILASTSRDLEAALAGGRMQEDLFHQLNVVTVRVPPLRERREDIPALAGSFLARFASDLGLEKPRLSRSALDRLCGHSWPGNVRELRDCLRHALVLARGRPLQREDIAHSLGPARQDVPAQRKEDERSLREFVQGYLALHAGPGCESKLLETVEKEALVEALRRAKGNRTRAAALLGLPRPTLHGKLQKHCIRTMTVVDQETKPRADRPPLI